MESNNNIKERIRQLVGKAKTEQALDTFIEWASANDKDLNSDLISIKAQLSALKRNENMGVMDFRETQVSRARITNAILSLLEDAEMPTTTSVANASSNNSNSSSNTGSNPTAAANNNRLKVFYSYSHKDKEYLQSLQAQLKILERLGKIEVWSDDKILPGERWDDHITHKLQSADIILLLISADFLNSDYIWNTEFKIALERESRKEASIVPIILKKCLWRETPLKALQAIPHDDNGRLKPVDEWGDRDKAFANIAEDLAKLISSRSNR